MINTVTSVEIRSTNIVVRKEDHLATIKELEDKNKAMQSVVDAAIKWRKRNHNSGTSTTMNEATLNLIRAIQEHDNE